MKPIVVLGTENSFLSALDIIRHVESGHVSVTELAATRLDHIAQVDARLLAFAAVDPQVVSQEARRLDRLIAAGKQGPLAGVPVGVKDNIDVSGLPTAAGFKPYEGLIVERDAAIVNALRTLGCLIIGKTHTAQFAYSDPAPTLNPWNVAKSPAGSSAGSAVAVAAGMVPIAIGTQTGGSVLRPAAFNGVVGFKPSYGWYPLDGVIPLAWSLDHLGLFGATVEDVHRCFAALTGSLGLSRSPKRPPRIAVMSEFVEHASSEVRQHVDAVLSTLQAAGTPITHIDRHGLLDHALAAHSVIYSAEAAALHSQNLRRHEPHYGPKLRATIEAGALIPAPLYLEAQRQRTILSQSIAGIFESADLLLLPTVSTPPCARGSTGERSCQVPASLLGLPAISLPTGLTRHGLPLAIQLVGHRRADHKVLSFASWLTQVVSLIPLFGMRTQWQST